MPVWVTWQVGMFSADGTFYTKKGSVENVSTASGCVMVRTGQHWRLSDSSGGA